MVNERVIISLSIEVAIESDKSATVSNEGTILRVQDTTGFEGTEKPDWFDEVYATIEEEKYEWIGRVADEEDSPFRPLEE